MGNKSNLQQLCFEIACNVVSSLSVIGFDVMVTSVGAVMVTMLMQN